MSIDLRQNPMESITSLTKQIRQESRSVRNRLQSIIHDSKWVLEVADAYQLPLIPNERCGLWYVPPDHITETAYFKSTDGHTTQWSFSTRRLNFHLFDTITSHDGIIAVDSTRRGKTMPDALSKTIPIWCATLNYLMFGPRENNHFYVPLQIISKSEEDSIRKLIPLFAQRLLSLKIITGEQLLERFNGKYLRPLWVYPGMSLPFEPPIFDDFYPIVCCVASERADDGVKNIGGFTYVQGAADDHELWAQNLNPTLFWENFDTLKNTELGDGELLEIIDKLELKKSSDECIEAVVKLTDHLSVGKVIDNVDTDHDLVILLSEKFGFKSKAKEKQVQLHYKVGCNKKGSNQLRKYLPEIQRTIDFKFPSRILILCESGTDLSIGIALLTLCKHYDSDWHISTGSIITKEVIKRHLAKILQFKKVNPSRATLQSINSSLM